MTRTRVAGPLGVLLLSFGSARDDGDVPAYLRRVRGGRPVPDALVEDLRMRYRSIGGKSPLLEITRRQARALEVCLDPGGDGEVLVREAMLHSAPEIADAVAALHDAGVTTLVAIPLAPQESPHGAAYARALAEATMHRHMNVHVADGWHLEPCLVEALADGVGGELARLPAAERAAARVLFTAHSLPRAVPGTAAYELQVRETAAAVALRAVPAGGWRVVFQSRSGPAGEWLGPDILDVVAELGRERCPALVAAPVQFVADHLEVLFDLDVAVRRAAEDAGMRYLRPPSLNASPALVETLASVMRRTLDRDAVDWESGAVARPSASPAFPPQG